MYWYLLCEFIVTLDDHETFRTLGQEVHIR